MEELQLTDDSSNSLLQFSHIEIKKDYRKKWNIHYNDFICLTRNGVLLRDTLYRIGGLNTPNLNADKYFMLLKHVEAFYPKNITDYTKSDPKHLESRWCILDKDGNEKVEFNAFKSPYMIVDSCIYSIDSNYYNIETGEHYGHAYTKMESTDYLFLDTRYNKDKTKRGVMKINKSDGKWELFSSL